MRPFARDLGSVDALEEIESLVRVGGNDARWQRRIYGEAGALADVVLEGAELRASRPSASRPGLVELEVGQG